MVVATDSMKNFVHAMGLEYEGDTLEGFVELVGSRLLARYDHIEGVQVSAKQVPFEHVRGNVMRRRYDDFAVAELDLDRSGVVSARSGWHGLHLIKLTGSSFAGFVRDEYTTLPEAHDRPLFVHMNVGWTNADLTRCAPCEDVRDVAVSTFCDIRSASIQELVYQIGVARARELRADRRGRLLRREPALGQRADRRRRGRLHRRPPALRRHHPDARAMIIPARFNGPPGSANGGYACGLFSEALGGGFEITLLLPPPLDTQLDIAGDELRHGDVVDRAGAAGGSLRRRRAGAGGYRRGRGGVEGLRGLRAPRLSDLLHVRAGARRRARHLRRAGEGTGGRGRRAVDAGAGCPRGDRLGGARLPVGLGGGRLPARRRSPRPHGGLDPRDGPSRAMPTSSSAGESARRSASGSPAQPSTRPTGDLVAHSRSTWIVPATETDPAPAA